MTASMDASAAGRATLCGGSLEGGSGPVESEDVTGGGALDGAAWDVVEVPGALWLRIGASLDEDAAG